MSEEHQNETTEVDVVSNGGAESVDQHGHIEQVDLQTEMQRSYLDYAMAVIIGRVPAVGFAVALIYLPSAIGNQLVVVFPLRFAVMDGAHAQFCFTFSAVSASTLPYM